ncbi:MAG: aromatic ring-hydroxylating dioxygenase subunit alpha [Streptosporangiales bacterium]|nr:aromatic ring-hydroxylating dioxygenase subunit alpha [Streptosporangiales bacterium]
MSTIAPSTLLPILPGRYYTEPEWLRADRRAIFERSWNCVARADELAAPGDFVQVEVGTELVLVVRNRTGGLGAFLNLCRHRGAVLCREAAGSFGKRIRCMYHAWTYDLDGRLVAAPNIHDMPDLVKDEYGLHGVRLEEWLGYVWVNLDATAAPLSDQVRPQLVARLGDADTLDRYGIGDLVVGHTISYDVASNWKSVVENFMECYHCASIHPELTAALPQFRSGYGSISNGVRSGAVFAPGMAGFSSSGRAVRPMLPGLRPDDDRLFYGIILRPNVFVILVPDHVAVFRITPVDTGHTRVVVDWLFEPAEVAKPDFDPGDAVDLLDITNRQDFEACERCHLGMASSRYGGVLVPAEHVVQEFYDWYLSAIGQECAG